MAHGELIDGVWHTRFHNTKATGGRFQRGQPKYRNWVTADGSPGPSGSGGFPAAPGAIISTSRSPARGRIARSRSAS